MRISGKSGLLVLMALFLFASVSSAASDADKHYYKGVEYTSEGKFIQAREEFKEALKIDPGDRFFKSSLRQIEDAIDLKIKKEAVMHLFKGVALVNKGMLEKSITEFTMAIEIDPKLAGAYSDRGVSYYKKGQYDRAISDHTKAIEIDPKNARSYYNRGRAYDEKGQYDRAISDYTKAIEINPKYTNAYYNLGFVYTVNLNEKTKGCKNWEKACELGKCKNYNLAKRRGDCK